MHIRRPIRSPLQRKVLQPVSLGIDNIILLVKQLETLRTRFEAAVAEAEHNAKTVARGERGPEGPPGRSIRGEKGERGEKGAPGADAPMPDIEEIVSRVVPRIRVPKDGITPEIDYARITSEVLQSLEKTEIPMERIKGLNKALQNMLDRYGMYVHGGGDTVAAGTNVVLTRDTNGNVVINAIGGGGGNAVYGEVVDGSGTSWTLDNSPTAGTLRLYANGQRLTETVDYSVTGTAVTTVLSWQAGTLLADYSYV